jgi:hypothetical protein
MEYGKVENMRILKNEGTFEILSPLGNVISSIATAARTCYQSQDKANPESDINLVKNIIARGRMAQIGYFRLEHVSSCFWRG